MGNDTPPVTPQAPPPVPRKPVKKGCLAAAAIIGMLLVILVSPVIVGDPVDSARATTMKGKCRAIWLFIMSANMDRETNGLPPLWPADLAQHGVTFANAEAYFTYLMSDGTNTTVIAEDPSQRLVGDLGPEQLAASGLKPARPGGPVLPENNAWHVVMVGEHSPAETPFLVSRNAKASDLAYPNPWELQSPGVPGANGVLIALDKSVKPLGGLAAVWSTRGGMCLDARKRLLTRARVCPIEQPEHAPKLTVLPAQGGFQ